MYTLSLSSGLEFVKLARMSSAPSPTSNSNDQLELRKLRAETEKAEAERDKILEELLQSRQLWTRLAKSITPLVAALTITFGYLAARYNSQVAEARLEKAQAEFEKKLIVADKETAQHELAAAKEDLTATNKQIALANDAKSRAETATKSSQQQLASIRTEYAALQKQQLDRQTFGNLQKLIDILDSEPPERQTASSRYIEDIRKEVAGDGNQKPERLAYLITAAQNHSHRPALRALLYLSLFEVTSDNQWLDEIRRLASERLPDAWPTFQSLLFLPNFDVNDRATVICSNYTHELKESQTSNGSYSSAARRYEINRRLLAFDPEALLRCRAPYLDQIEPLKQSWNQQAQQENMLVIAILDSWKINQRTGGASSDSLITKPWQPMLLWYLADHQTSPNLTQVLDKLSDLGAPPDLISAIKAGTGQSWVAGHQRLYSIRSPPGFNSLRTMNDSAMTKIMSGQWISERDLD